MLYWWHILRDTFKLWMERNAFMYAGSLAFYTLFSLAPVMIIAVTIIGLVFGEEAAQGRIVAQLEDTIGADAAGAVEFAVAQSQIAEAGLLPTIIGIGALLLGATTVFAQMQVSLNAIWGVMAKPSRSGLLILLKNRLLSLTVVLAIGFILLVSLLLSIGLRAIIAFAEDWVPLSTTLFSVAEIGISLAVITLLFGMIFKILPDVVMNWRDVFLGALVTAVLFALGRYGIALYLTYTATASTYGAAASLVLMLLWVYYSSLILLFGAAFTKVHMLARGRSIMPRNMAVRVNYEIVEERADYGRP